MAPTSQREWGTYLLHPATLVAIAVLLVNDHLLKGMATRAGSPWALAVTGKLSDFAGLIFFPLLVAAIFELAARRPRVEPFTLRMGWIAIGLVGVVFTLIQLWPPAAAAYQWTVGAIVWPAHAIGALIRGAAISPLKPAGHSADPTDLIALTALAVPAVIFWRTARGAP